MRPHGREGELGPHVWIYSVSHSVAWSDDAAATDGLSVTVLWTACRGGLCIAAGVHSGWHGQWQWR